MYTITDAQRMSVSEVQFHELCRANRELRLERSATGELVVMAPTGGETGRRNGTLFARLWVWNEQTGLGVAFDSSTGFRLPNGAYRSPDVSWVERERWNGLSDAERERFPPLCPDFVAELRSTHDELPPLQAKMRAYLANGARLGWLFDPANRQVEVYQLGQPVTVVRKPTKLTGGTVLPGFVLDLSGILD